MAELNFDKPVFLKEGELLPDPTIILKETPDEPPEELTAQEELLKKLKEKAMKCKCIALSSMGFHPINTNGSHLHRNKRKELLTKMTTLFDKPDEEINKEFNELICDELLHHTADYQDYPVYKRSYKQRAESWVEDLEKVNININN